MKDSSKMVLGIVIFVVGILLLNNTYREYEVNAKDSTVRCSIRYKGLSEARDFTIDEKGNYYIAFKDKIQYIDKNGKSYDLFSNDKLNINSIVYNKGNLYYATDTKVLAYNISTSMVKEIVRYLPNLGDYCKSLLTIKGSKMYITIGAATNSGVVGSDNLWLKDNPYIYDTSPKEIVLSGLQFGNEKTGGFVAYKTKSAKDQVIPAHSPGNASILVCDLNNGNVETFAWGIRNVNGLDFDSNNKLIAAVGGMEDRGLRPVRGDSDYIYEIKKDNWYGWPDFSGGEPITSEIFQGKDNKMIPFILAKHPTENLPQPLYKHKYLNSLGTLAIDSKGIIGEKNSIYFYDNIDNIIYEFTKNGTLREKLQLKNYSKINSIKFSDEEMMFLDSNEGALYTVTSNGDNESAIMNKKLLFYFLIITTFGIIIGVVRLKE